MELRLGQDLTMPRSKLQPFRRGQGLQKAWFGTRPGAGSPRPGLSSSSQPSSPDPTTMKEPLPSQSPLPGAPLSQLMTPSLQWLQREREALGSAHPLTAGPRDTESLHSGHCGVHTDIPGLSLAPCREGGCHFMESSTQLHFL